MQRKVTALLLAGGSSTRMGEDKMMIELAGKTVLRRSAELLNGNSLVTELVVVTRPDRIETVGNMLSDLSKLRAVTAGGSTRLESAKNGTAASGADTEFFCIHDAARPFASDDLVTRTIEAAFEYGASVNAVPAVDTIKIIDNDGNIVSTPDRSLLRASSTPQVLRADEYRRLIAGLHDAFDDAQIFENAGLKVKIVDGERTNFKITTTEDISRARTMLGDIGIRVGHGYDVHRFKQGRRLVLGGVEVPYELGLDGHSDADVLTHAVADAVLGAANCGDIGKLFPDNDDRFLGIDSLVLLKEAVRVVGEKGYQVVNADATLVMQRPKISAFTKQMSVNLADALGVEPDSVSVKATTEEKLGFTGSGEGASAHAVVLLTR